MKSREETASSRPVQEIGYMMFLTNIWTFILRNNEGKLSITYDKNLDAGYGKKARGYHGVHVLVNVLDRL